MQPRGWWWGGERSRGTGGRTGVVERDPSKIMVGEGVINEKEAIGKKRNSFTNETSEDEV